MMTKEEKIIEKLRSFNLQIGDRLEIPLNLNYSIFYDLDQMFLDWLYNDPLKRSGPEEIGELDEIQKVSDMVMTDANIYEFSTIHIPEITTQRMIAVTYYLKGAKYQRDAFKKIIDEVKKKNKNSLNFDMLMTDGQIFECSTMHIPEITTQRMTAVTYYLIGAKYQRDYFKKIIDEVKKKNKNRWNFLMGGVHEDHVLLDEIKVIKKVG